MTHKLANLFNMSVCSNESFRVVWRSYDSNGSVQLSFSIENFPDKVYTCVVLTTLVIACFGLFANAISFFIHIQPAFRSNFNLLLAALAVWDSFNLLSVSLILRTHAEFVITLYSGRSDDYKEYWEYPLILLVKVAGNSFLCTYILYLCTSSREA